MSAEDYLRRVAHELRDLPWRLRRDLVEELRAHLAELPAGTDLLARLGTPEAYAADLRSTAGLERRRGTVAFLRARRPRTLLLAAAALVAVGLAIGAVAWIQSYQPIAFAGAALDPYGAKEAAGGTTESVVFHDGQPFRLGITVENSGRFAVRVLGVPLSTGLPFSARLLMSGPLKDPSAHPPFRRFRPFDLQPGEIRVLLLKGSYTRCHAFAPAAVVGLPAIPVRYSFLWRTATVAIPLPQQLGIVFPKSGSCR
ncbi:MAG TPA: hypothetical protein VJ814_06340 [Gaiellaceae bacterium]|nr:hypothetical protein [Gaiellaceae bacterium]